MPVPVGEKRGAGLVCRPRSGAAQLLCDEQRLVVVTRERDERRISLHKCVLEESFGMGSGFDEAAPDRVASQLDPIAHAELLEHVCAVAIDRLLADEELRRDLIASQTL